MRMVWLLAVLVGCNDYGFGLKDSAVDAPLPPEETATPQHTDPPETGDTAPLEEVCNGEDDDLDGEIDEGFDDIDADGIADCVDDDCNTVEAAAGVPLDKLCVGGTSGVPKDPWNAVVQWNWSGGDIQSTPSVGDLDRDGVPEVVVTSDVGLMVFDGASGTLEQTLPGVDSQSGVSLGDIDGDGYGEMVATTGACYTAHSAVAYDRTGSQIWSTAVGSACETYPYIADLEGDGDVEVIVNQHVLDGATGAIVATLDVSGSNNWGAPVAADMDGDGVMEILLENRVYSDSGVFLWSCGGGGIGTFPQPVDVDKDDDGEMLTASSGLLTLCDHGGSTLWTRPLNAFYGSPVAVADFDGDGAQEFAIADSGQLLLIDRDGSTLWTTPISDYSGLAGCTSWDVDADGVPEVIYADEDDFLVLDGATGMRVVVVSSHSSITLAETPAVADVDGDGRGELLYGSNGATRGLTVLTSGLDEWPYAPPVYNQYGYYGGNINADLSVPAGALPPWLTPAKIFRGQPSPIYFEPALNAGAEIADVCAASCLEGGYAEVSFQVYADGGTETPAGTLVHVYALAGGKGTLIYEWNTPDVLLPGETVEHTFETTVDVLGPELLVVVDPYEALGECDEDDNLYQFDGVPCH